MIPLKILLIDDDLDDVKLFEMALATVDPKAELLHAADGDLALDLLNKLIGNMPDYVFLDLNMPRMDGRQCLDAIKKNTYFKHLPVIIYTTSKSPVDIAQTKALGACCFIIKPTDFSDIERIIRLIIQEKPTTGRYMRGLVEIF